MPGGVDQQSVLIRGCWAQVGDRGFWWDIDAEEAIDIPIVAWAPLPGEEELAGFAAAEGGRGFV